MRSVVVVVLMVLGLAFGWTSPTLAEKRVALIIGNNDYSTLPDLENARKDATDMAAKLRRLGFEVILKTNAGRREMGRALAEFEGKLSSSQTGLVFYAGHGIQANGRNYLIPSDARIEVEEDLRYAGKELPMALKQGVVDGQENPLSVIYHYRLYVVQPHLALTRHVYNSMMAVASKKTWAKLASDQRKILREEARKAGQWFRDVQRKEEIKAARQAGSRRNEGHHARPRGVQSVHEVCV